MVLIAVISIPTWLLLDNFILKKVLILSLEKATKKEVYLENLAISYFPNIKIELKNLKIPNPFQDNYLIIAKDLLIDIDTNALLQKSIIINNITSNSASLMDASEIPVKIIIEHSKKNQEKSDISSTLKNYFKTSLSMYSDSEVKSNIDSKFTLGNELNDLNTIIDTSTELINEKKDNVLKQSTSTLYQINKINIDAIQTIDQLNETQKTMSTIAGEYESISKEINDIENIYNQSDIKIKEINNNLNQKIDASFSFEIIKDNVTSTTNYLSTPVKNIVNHFLTKLRKNNEKKTDSKFTGITYNFRKVKTPKFLIKKIEINTFDNDHYLKGLNLTTSQNIQKDLKLYMKLLNKSNYEKLILNLISSNNRDYEIVIRARNIYINKIKLYETEDIVVNFLENRTTNLDITGTFSPSSNIIAKAIIKKPNYRVINKKTTPHFLTDFIPYLNNEDISIDVTLSGKLDELAINATSNLDPLISSVQNRMIDKKLVEIKKQKKREIKRIKEEKLGETNKKSTEFSNDYAKTLNQLKFQEKEINNQKEMIERRINQKKVQIENSIMNELKTNVKKINLNGLSN